MAQKLNISYSHLYSGPLSSILVNKYGSRPVVMMGGLLCSAGMVAASFSSSVIELYLAVGLLGGKFCFQLVISTLILFTKLSKKHEQENILLFSLKFVFIADIILNYFLNYFYLVYGNISYGMSNQNHFK